MRHRRQNQLAQELRQSGATDAEVAALLPLAASLRVLQPQTETTTAPAIRSWSWLLKPALFGLSGVIAGMALVILSQAVLPTSWLYPVQKLSDNVATAVHPQYKGEIMMKRAQQVNQLVSAHANPDVVFATLSSYTTEARGYKSTSGANYSAFEYCKTNLQQAAASATPAVRQAIVVSLDSLATV